MNKDKNNYHKQGTEFSKSCPATLFDLSDFGKKKVEVRFTLKETFNDGGLLLLKEVDNQIGLTDRLSGCIKEDRHQGLCKAQYSIYAKAADHANLLVSFE